MNDMEEKSKFDWSQWVLLPAIIIGSYLIGHDFGYKKAMTDEYGKARPKEIHYLSSFPMPVKDGNLEILIGETKSSNNYNRVCFLKVDDGYSYISSEVFLKEYAEIADSIGYKIEREKFILQHASLSVRQKHPSGGSMSDLLKRPPKMCYEKE
jgi:hypothetical protein